MAKVYLSIRHPQTEQVEFIVREEGTGETTAVKITIKDTDCGVIEAKAMEAALRLLSDAVYRQWNSR